MIQIGSEGLRARKKRATRAAIQQAALTLFIEKGYDATRMEDIARAADVSPGTLFNYFPTKERLVTDQDDPMFVSLLEGRPAQEPLFVALRAAMEEGLRIVVKADREAVMVRARLMRQAPALQAAAAHDRERSANLLREVLAKRSGRPQNDFELRLLSVTVVAILTAAGDAWLESDARDDLLDLAARALDAAERGFGGSEGVF